MKAEEPIERVILFQLDKTSKIAKQYSQKEFDRLGLGITVDQWVLLKIIEESAPLSQKELAKLSTRDPASITRTLDLLEKKQLIQRENIKGNRRQYNIILTNQGNDFVKTNLALVSEHRRKSVEGLSEEDLKQLQSMLLKIQQNMES